MPKIQAGIVSCAELDMQVIRDRRRVLRLVHQHMLASMNKRMRAAAAANARG